MQEPYRLRCSKYTLCCSGRGDLGRGYPPIWTWEGGTPTWEGGTPIQTWEQGTPIQTWEQGTPPTSWMGYPPPPQMVYNPLPGGYPHLDLGRGYPHLGRRYPLQTWEGGTPMSRPGKEYPPSRPEKGVPPSRPGKGIPLPAGWGAPPPPQMVYNPLPGGTPTWTWEGGTPHPDLGRGYPPASQMGYPPPTTNGVQSENITSSRTTYAVGNETYVLYNITSGTQIFSWDILTDHTPP